MSLTEAINEIQTLLNQTKSEIQTLEQFGRKSSAPRARKHAQSIKNLAHNLRKSITGHVSTIPVKTRTRKEIVAEAVPEAVAEPVAEVVEPVDEFMEMSPITKKPRKKKVLKPIPDGK
jgi:hypothetical protein